MNKKQQVKFVATNKTPFFSVLKSRVDQYFIDNNISKHANGQMVIKSIIMISAYVIPFIFWLLLPPTLATTLIIWVFMGLAVAGIGMSVMHDANHGAYSENNEVNFWMGATINLVGGSIFNWKLQHNILHHTYTNITHIDEDIQDRLVLKFSPHTALRWYHRFQWIYALMFYGLLTLYWAVGKDFVQFYQYTKSGVNANNSTQNIVTFIKIVLVKVGYFFVLVAMPIWFFHIPTTIVLSGFFAMHFVAGLILTLIFQLAHTLEHTAHPMPVDGIIDNDWAIHQLNTTVNFSRKSKWISWYLGGLNFQVEHHLFPRISHVHYPALAHIVKQTAEEYNIPYLENITFMDAVKSHFRFLKQVGKLPHMNHAIN